MRRREEHRDGGDDGEEGERDEAEAVEHHGGELPVVLDGRRVLVVSDLCAAFRGGGGMEWAQNDCRPTFDFLVLMNIPCNNRYFVSDQKEYFRKFWQRVATIPP